MAAFVFFVHALLPLILMYPNRPSKSPFATLCVSSLYTSELFAFFVFPNATFVMHPMEFTVYLPNILSETLDDPWDDHPANWRRCNPKGSPGCGTEKD